MCRHIHSLLVADGVPHLVRGRPARATPRLKELPQQQQQTATCSLYLNLPRNGVAVELVSAEFGGATLQPLCEARPFDLCAES